MHKKRIIAFSTIFLLLIGLIATLSITKQIQNYRSNAAAADKLEIEGGVLSSTGVSKQTDSNASGGQYILFQNQTTNPTCPTNLQTAIDNTAANGTLDVTGCSPFSGTFTISKAMTLKGAKISAPANGPGISISADNVTITGANITGTQATVFRSGEKCVAILGTSSNILDNVVIKDSTISRCGYGGIYASFAKSAQISNNNISDSVYSGILLASVSNSTVSNNTILRTGVYGASANSYNAYGITATQEGTNPPSTDVIIQGNTIDTVPLWHGLDTHAGVRISFLNNTVRGARRGIFLTISPTNSTTNGNDITAPTATQISTCKEIVDGRDPNYCSDIRGIQTSGGTGSITNNIGHNFTSDRWFTVTSGTSASGYTSSGNNPTIPLAPSPSNSSGTYGPGIDMDTKDNQQIGTSSNYKYSIKFRASQTSQVTGFRVQWRTGPVYSGTSGNYGTIRITLRPDDGSGKPSNTILASVDVSPNNLSLEYDNGGQRTTNFSNPPSLTAGNLYHLHLENIHSTPTTNYISINSMFTFDLDTKILGRYTPHFKNEDYGIMRSTNGGSWTALNNDTPALDIIYANGGHDGLAVQAIAQSSTYPMPLIGGNNMIRERFTVQGGNKTVTKLWARIGRLSGSSNAIISLENGNGTVIEEGQAQGSGSIPTIPQGDPQSKKGTWVSYTLSQPRTLINGQTYNLRVSAPVGTSYQHTCVLSQDSTSQNGLHDMKSYAFNEGHGEKSTNGGSSWDYCYGNFYHNNTQTVMEIQ